MMVLKQQLIIYSMKAQTNSHSYWQSILQFSSRSVLKLLYCVNNFKLSEKKTQYLDDLVSDYNSYW